MLGHWIISVSTLAALSVAAPTALPAGSLLSEDVETLERDVCVIGGGASGTYAAVRLQQEGKSVALFEKQSQLGGHVDTYTDPNTGLTVDYGVQVFSDLPVLRNFFSHFNVPLVAVSASEGAVGQNVNFLTGQVITENIDPAALGGALLGYQAQLQKYPGISSKWNLPSPVPEDLLMDFGDFLVKYNLTVIGSLAFSYNQGMGNILAQPTLFVMKYFNAQLVSDLLTGGLIRNGLSNNQLVYDRAQAELGANVFVNSPVISVTRSDTGVQVFANTPDGPRICSAPKLLLTIPPKLEVVTFLDLDDNERSIFSKFNNSYYWDAVVKNTGLADNLTLTNVNQNAPLGIPAMPAVYTISATGIPDHKLMYYSSPGLLSLDDVKSGLLGSLSAITQGQNLTVKVPGPEIVALGDHSPFMLTVSKDQVASGFYDKFQALQGKRNTWWSGAAWNTHATAPLYNFTEYEILPHLLKA